MDLVAVAWIDDPKPHLELIHGFCDYLGVPKFNDVQHYMYSVLAGGRDSYVINLNRGGNFNSYLDAQYYLDISFTPKPASSQSAEIDRLRSIVDELHAHRKTIEKSNINYVETIDKLQAEIERLKARLNATHVIAEKRLTDFFMWFRENGEKYVDKSIESMIEIYLNH
jgi:hypothetical protein